MIAATQIPNPRGPKNPICIRRTRVSFVGERDLDLDTSNRIIALIPYFEDGSPIPVFPF